MAKRILMLSVAFLTLGFLVWAGGAKATTFTGTVSDSQCGVKHAIPSAAAADCVEKTVSNGGQYVLVSAGKVFQLIPQEKFKGLGGKSVKITGELQGDTIAASTVETAQP